MADEFGLDDAFDGASEGLTGVDELDLAQDREDRMAAESQTDTAAAEEESDFLTEKFIYTDPEGNEAELTGQELLEARNRTAELEAKVQELETKATQVTEKPAEQTAKPGEGGAIEPVAWEQVGPTFQSMLEEGREAEIGPALNDVIHRTIFTSPAVANIISQYVDTLLEAREQGKQTQTKFQEFVGDEIPETEIKSFMTANPWARTRETAILGIQKARLEKQITDLKTAKTTEVAEAKKTGAKDTVKSLKAKGTLRRLGGGGTRRSASSNVAENIRSKIDLKDENQRISGAVALVQAMRQGRT